MRALSDATAYCAAKFGMVGFTRALAAELAGQVGVTLLVPGGMRTNFFDGRTEQYRPGPDAALNDPANVAAAVRTVEGLQADGSTNLYDGVGLALKGLDEDRATSVILVTDGVTNTGVVDPKSLEALGKQHDVRIFGFVIGNNANWPLVRLIAEATGGFYAAMSNEDDLLGQLLLAKSKITSEALHDATLKISGVRISDATDGAIGKIYRGQQLVVFGRYEQGGRATVTLQARMTGEDKTYTAAFDTSKGAIKVTLDPVKMPSTTNNFVVLSRYHYYDNTALFRVDPTIQIVQGGAPGTNSASDPGPGYTIPDENLKDASLKGNVYPAGTIAMANTGQKHTGGSQFFLVYQDSQLPPTYTPFGTVDAAGMNVLKKIAAAGESTGAGDGAPNATVVINKATVAKS